jgi:lipoprotein-anchoring transpeptidase ErfK/SrfK
LFAALVFFAVSLDPGQAAAHALEARIDLSDQRMHVLVNGRPAYSWDISSGRRGYRTPTGSWQAKRLERIWYSSKYENAPMPHSVFFYGGYAIHGTNDIRNLGRPVSHGCVRLRPNHARIFFDLVRNFGRSNTLVVIRN